MNWSKLFSIAFLLLGGYYLFVAVRIISTEVIIGSSIIDNRIVGLFAMFFIALGLLLNEGVRREIRNAFA